MPYCEAWHYGKEGDLWFAQVQFNDKRSEISFVFAVLYTYLYKACWS